MLNFLSVITEDNDLDLKTYSLKIKDELKKLENEISITDYFAVNQDVAFLYQSLEESNGVLDKIEDIIDGFQKKLGEIAENVSRLQDKSHNYTVQLENRRALEKDINIFLESVMISPDLIERLLKTDEIDKDYIHKDLEEFNKILQTIKTNEDAAKS